MDGVRKSDQAEFDATLRSRLVEESTEDLAATTPVEGRAKLADVQAGLSPAELEVARQEKASGRGGFAARLWWVW